MSNWTCLVHLPGGSEEVRHISGPAPVHNGFITLDRDGGIWLVERVRPRDFEAVDGTRLDGEIWVRPADEEELANHTGIR
jgi:hypothetical protein